jgi:hypothetical protein
MFEIVQHFLFTLLIVEKEDEGDDHSHFHLFFFLSLFIATNQKHKLTFHKCLYIMLQQ